MAIAAFTSIVVGLPIVVDVSSRSTPWYEALNTTSSVADASDAITIRNPISLSNHWALTLDNGLLSQTGSAPPRSLKAAELFIDEAMVTLDLSRSAASVKTGAPGSKKSLAESRIDDFKIGTLQIRRGKLALVTAAKVRHVIHDVEARVIKTRGHNLKISATGIFKGEQIALTASFADLPPVAGKTQAALQLKIHSRFLSTTFDGTIEAPALKGQTRAAAVPVLTGHAEFELPSLKNLIAWSDLDQNLGDQIKRIGISGHVNWSTTQLAFSKAQIDMDGSTATGALTYSHAGPQPIIDGTLAFDVLDLRQALSLAPAEPVKQSATDKGNGAQFFSIFAVDLRLSASRFLLPQIETGRGAMTISLSNRQLEANLVGLELAGGTTDAQFAVDATHSPPTATIKIKSKNITIPTDFATAGIHSPFAGPADVSFKGKATGNSLNDVINRLTGHGELSMVETGTGKLGIDVSALLNAARAKPVVSWTDAGQGSTPVNKLKCRFRLLNGAITVESMQANTATHELFATGQIDVPGRLLDMNVVRVETTPPAGTAASRDQVSMRGTWANPSISLSQSPLPKEVKLSPAN
ncbi:MAG: AsmA family protein [Hyphomicrobiaceae bacterium]